MDETTMESRILILMTGGTICMRPTPDGLAPAQNFLDTGMACRPSFNDGQAPASLDAWPEIEGPARPLKSLRTPRSRFGRHVRYAVLEFADLLDSSSIDARGWTLIALCIQKNYALFDGFVVLHGTDSLAYTSSALSFMLNDLGKPFILTGSQAPIHELQNDATDNLLGSLIMAGHFHIPEVCLFFNHKLYRGNRCTKVSADQFAAFASPNFEPLATITSSQIHVNWDAVARPSEIRAFNVRTDLRLAHVACLRIFPGIKPEMIDAVLRVPGLQGLVLETFGAGNAPSGSDNALINIFTDAVQRGIVIVNVTQCLTGSVSPLYAPAMILGKAGIVPGRDMTTEAALTKLSYLLALPGITIAHVTQRMSASVRGELTESNQTSFRHARPMGGHDLSWTLLPGFRDAIAAGDLAKVSEVLGYETSWVLDDIDANGDAPLHLAACGSSDEVLRCILQRGANVHMRDGRGRTPLFIAASHGVEANVALLQSSGAHLHPTELPEAQRLCEAASSEQQQVWRLTGLGR